MQKESAVTDGICTGNPKPDLAILSGTPGASLTSRLSPIPVRHGRSLIFPKKAFRLESFSKAAASPRQTVLLTKFPMCATAPGI